MKTILTLARKDLALFLRDRTALMLTFIVPVMLIYLFGNIFSGGGESGPSSGIKLAILDLNQTEVSTVLVEALKKEDGFRIFDTPKNENSDSIPFTEESIRQGIVDRHYNFALIIPKEIFAENAIGLRIKYLFNPVNAVESQIVNGLLQRTIFSKIPQLFAKRLKSESIDVMGEENYNLYVDKLSVLVADSFDLAEEDVRNIVTLDKFLSDASDSEKIAAGSDTSEAPDIFSEILNIEEDQVYGKKIKNPQITRMIGGYAVMFLLFAVTASASSMFEEKKSGLFLRLLSMPITRTQILWSKYLYNFGLGLFQILALFAGGAFLFDVDIISNFPVLLIVSMTASASCISFGMLLASLSKTPAQANGLATFLILAMSAVGGAWFPVSFMPEFIQSISKFTLVYWSIQGFQGALWQGSSLIELLPTIGILLGITAVVNAFSIWKFKTGDLFR